MSEEKIEGKRVLLIDGYNIFYQMFQKHSAKDQNGEPIGGFIGSLNFVQKTLDKLKCNECYVIYDGVDAGRRRRSQYSKYKDKRGRKSRSTCVTINDEIKEHINNEQNQLISLFQTLKQLPVKLVAIPHFEADDVIAYVCQSNPNNQYIIASSDKDYLQLVRDNVWVWSPIKEILFTPEVFKSHYEMSPENYLYLRTAVGDPSDELGGIKGVGEKTIKELLPQIKENTYEDFWQFWDDIDKLDNTKKKTVKILKESKEQLHLMYKLMSLSRDNLNLSAIEILQQQLEEQKDKGFSKIGFKLYSIKHKLVNHIKNYDVWIRPFTILK